MFWISVIFLTLGSRICQKNPRPYIGKWLIQDSLLKTSFLQSPDLFWGVIFLTIIILMIFHSKEWLFSLKSRKTKLLHNFCISLSSEVAISIYFFVCLIKVFFFLERPNSKNLTGVHLSCTFSCTIDYPLFVKVLLFH